MYFNELPEYYKSVLLAFNNETHRGPGKVAKNLQEGLQRLGAHVVRPGDGNPKYKGYLQPCHFDYLRKWRNNKEAILMGPNLFVLPTDAEDLCKSFDNFIVPSTWVKNKYLKFDLLKNKNIFVWPVGIDTNEWNDEGNKEKDVFDCLVYHKNRSDKDLAIVKAICRKFGLTFKILKYGEYFEEDLKTACKNSRFAILVNGTESQGIAYMQILSTNTPCYVFNKPTWSPENDKSFVVDATSIPYWNEKCGEVTDNVDLGHFKDFLNKLENNSYSPREYIVKNHTLKISAAKYYNILRKIHGEEEVLFKWKI